MEPRPLSHGYQTRIGAGLSPRVRGNQDFHQVDAVHLRSIPACAGNRLQGRPLGYPPGSIPACAGEPIKESLLNNGFRVYPRVCGGTNAKKTGA